MNKKTIQSASVHAATTHAQAKADAVEGKPEPKAIPPWPWVVHEERFVAAADGSPVVNMCHPNKAVAKAIAPLLAAAPELLNAALLGLQIAENWAHEQLDGTDGLEDALAELEPIRRAIDKAKGSL